MGAINYCTSDYITLGLKPYNLDDFTNDQQLMEELQTDIDQYGGNIDDALNDYIQLCYESDYINIQTELEKHGFYYFHVTIKPGYYEGFTLDIENNFPVCFDYWQEKRDAQKEITEIKQFLIVCAGLGLVTCEPGWCTSYSDYKQTLEEIKRAVEIMRKEVKSTPTWIQYNKS